MTVNFPDKKALVEVANRLKRNHIEFALGGSGLLSFLGLPTEVHDWDITTDAPIESVEAALNDLSYTRLEPSGIFASKYVFKISLINTSIDLMGGFALKTADGIFHVPTVITYDWDGIPVGSPEVWLKVYKLLGRDQKAKQLQDFLNKSS